MGEEQQSASETGTQTTLPGTAVPPAPPPAPAPAPEPDKGKEVQMSSNELRKRLEQTRTSAEAKLLQRLGFEDVEKAQTVLAELRTIQESQLSDSERQQKTIDELKPKAAEAERLGGLVKKLVEQRFGALPEKAQEAIDKVAEGNAEKRLELITVMEASGMLGEVPASATTESGGNGQQQEQQAKPTAQPKSTAPAETPPKSGGAQNFWDQYQAITNPMEQAIFWDLNKAAIQRDRPADS